MNTLPQANQLRQQIIAYEQGKKIARRKPLTHADRVKQDLKDLGMTKYGLRKLESRYLPKIIHQDEVLGGVVYGIMEGSSVVLVATDRRIVFLDVKPFFVTKDEITYDVVGGVSFTHAGIWSTLTLHTRIRDYPILTYNEKSSNIFIRFLEERCLSKLNHESRFRLK